MCRAISAGVNQEWGPNILDEVLQGHPREPCERLRHSVGDRLETSADQQAARLGRRMWVMDKLMDSLVEPGLEITEIRVRPNRETHDVLIVVKARSESQQWVGFHAAETASEALAGAIKKLVDNRMKFREDRPYTPAS